ncbi:MAG: hypothetical protein VYA34_12470 [Myxococcota bacterium]|nr:hypothetical protein [Myxococcota bacterium]
MAFGVVSVITYFDGYRDLVEGGVSGLRCG